MTMKPALSLRPLILAAMLPALLSGCVSFGGKAPASMLVLTAKTSVESGVMRSGSASDALVILQPEVPRKIDTNRVPVKIDDSSMAYLKDAIWADKPARLMQQLLTEIMSAKNGRLVLSEVDAGGKAQQFLSGSLIEFGLDAATMEAVIVYDAVRLVRGQPVEKRRFEARKPVSSIEAAPAGVALNDAANDIALQMADWIG